MTAHEPSSTLPIDEKGRLKYLFPADELAWACYAPVLDLCNDVTGRQPPLVFLNGGLSPYALSRDQSFVAEDVPGEALSGRTYDPILHHLPFAVIGVPWYQLAHLPDIPVVARNWTHGRAGFLEIGEPFPGPRLPLGKSCGACAQARFQILRSSRASHI